MALKAFLFATGRRYVIIHSIHTLVQECTEQDSEFRTFEDYGNILDRYYLSTRNPDVLPEPAIPFESFTQADAQQALSYAREMVELVRVKVRDRQ